MGSFLRRWPAEYRVDLFAPGLFLVLLVLLAWRVETPVLHIWDEARLAVNAAEMLRSGDWLVTQYGGQPDLWNTKPPLLIWLQAAGLYLLGHNTLAIRLPSVAAALGTAWLVYRFGRYGLGSRFVGTFAALILATSPGFNGTHVARFGDYDAVLCLALTAAALCWYRYGQRRQEAQLWLGAGWFALALLTKSAAALLIMPSLAICLLVQPAHWVFGQWRTYGAVAAAFGPLALFYVLREAAAPGYLHATWANDWYGRLSQPLATVRYPWWIYFERLLFPGLLGWSLLLPVGSWLGSFAHRAAPPKVRFARFASLYVAVFLVVVSVARTRLVWYSAPVYPVAALLCALGLEQLTRQALHHWRWPRPVVIGLLVLAPVGAGAALLHHEWRRWQSEKTDPTLRYGYQTPLFAAAAARRTSFTILREAQNNAVLDFYVAASRQQGVPPTVLIAHDSTLRQLRPGQHILICPEPIQRYVRQHYRTRPLSAAAPCAFLEILGRKEPLLKETVSAPRAGQVLPRSYFTARPDSLPNR